MPTVSPPKPPFRAKRRSAETPANVEYLGRRRKRLAEHAAALHWLEQHNGLSSATIAYFGLGLSEAYHGVSGVLRDALVAPLMGRDGQYRKRYLYFVIPGVTLQPAAAAAQGWCKGPPTTYFEGLYRGQRAAFLCSDPREMWTLYQATRGTELAHEFYLICSTHRGEIPEEWIDDAFWADFEVIYCGFEHHGSAYDTAALHVAEAIGREVRRMAIPDWIAGRTGSDARTSRRWTDYWNAEGASTVEFRQLLKEAPVVALTLDDDTSDNRYGRFGYTPVDIDGAYHAGHLYYVCETLVRAKSTRQHLCNDTPVVIEEIDTVVVRSDATLHGAKVMPSRAGKRPVIRLTDGTVITALPDPNPYATWSWESITDYLDHRAKSRPLAHLLEDARCHLEACAWLPCADDYALLSLVVPATYLQSVFDTVPVICVNGAPNSGKTRIGAAMTALCANAHAAGAVTPQAIARMVHESRGLVVIDDLEAVRRRDRGGAFPELIQALKVSGNRRSAVKMWTDVATTLTSKLNFYGFKLILNTSPVDAMFGACTVHIHTRRMPEGIIDAFAARPSLTTHALYQLRQELHVWAYGHVAEVERAYRKVYPGPTGTCEEITAPLRALAALAGDDALTRQLNSALRRLEQEPTPRDSSSPQETLAEAMRNLIIQGYAPWITLAHVTLEMRRLTAHDHGREGEWPAWLTSEGVGKALRAGDYLERDAGPRRERLWGKQLRVLKLREDYLEQVRHWATQEGLHIAEAQQAFGFCSRCEDCAYRLVDCDIMAHRVAARRSLGGDTRE